MTTEQPVFGVLPPGLAGMFGHDPDSGESTLAPDVTCQIVLDGLACYATQHDFKPGTLIQQKAGLRARYINPPKGSPAIFIAWLSAAERDAVRQSALADDHPMPSDCFVGVAMPDGSFTIFLMHAAQFEPWEQK